MFGFSDYAEYRTNEQEMVRRVEQSRVAREAIARRQVAERHAADRAADRATERAAERAGRTKSAGTARPRVA